MNFLPLLVVPISQRYTPFLDASRAFAGTGRPRLRLSKMISPMASALIVRFPSQNRLLKSRSQASQSSTSAVRGDAGLARRCRPRCVAPRHSLSVVSFDFARRVAEFIEIPGANVGLGRDFPWCAAFFGERNVACAALESAQVWQSVESYGLADQSHRLCAAWAPRRLWRGIVGAFDTHGETRSVRLQARHQWLAMASSGALAG
jgi:hypothetical protein